MNPVPWKLWEGQVVDLCLPLRRYLGGTEQSAVYLTQYGDPEARNAAVKLVLAEEQDTEWLAQCERTVQLSHPHLLRLFRIGTCQVNQHALHYAVMEYAEENLADVLAERALTVAEVREMLPPLLDALAYIHGEGLVHGHLKPANIMAVGDQLKLSVDGICTVGDLSTTPSVPGAYDAPQFRDRGCSPLGDVWSFGMTLVEALTRELPRQSGPKQEPVLPETLPEEFVPMVRACLRPDPRKRAPLSDIVALFQHHAMAPAEPAPLVAPPAAWRKWLSLSLVGAGTVALVGILALPRLFQKTTPPSAAEAAVIQPAPAPILPAPVVAAPVVKSEPERLAPPPPAPAALVPAGREVVAKSGDVARQVMPEVTAQARRTIRGKVQIRVLASVDPTGHVTGAKVLSENSRYFANLTVKAVEKWGFVARDAASEWMLRFEFTNKGTDMRVSKYVK